MELDEREVRVLGSLVEKELSTPDYYPMTLNSLKAACNQKSNRDPVVDFSEDDVAAALDGLHRKRLVGNASSSYDRATKYRHALAEVMELGRPQLAVLSVLMLRGAHTVGEIRGRTTRMCEFSSLEEVEEVLEGLSRRDVPLVVQLPRRPGQKEARFAHMLAGEPAAEPVRPVTGMEWRVARMEDEIDDLREKLNALREAFDRFRTEFE